MFRFSYPKPTQGSHGFTLIELLIVIAIMSLLSAILFPVFGRARENARRSSCQSNMKQIGLAMAQYSADCDDQIPTGVIVGTVAYGRGWAGQIVSYIKNPEVFQCPDDTSLPSGGGGALMVSYGLNMDLTFVSGSPYPGPDAKMAALSAPSKTVMFEETANTYAFVDYTFSGCTYCGINETTSPSAQGAASIYPYGNFETGQLGGRARNASSYIEPDTGRHFDGSNFLLADGHVKWLPGSSVSSGFNANNGGVPAPNNAETAGDDKSNAYAAGTQNGGYAATFSAY